MDWSSNSSRWHMKFHNQKNNFTFYNRFQRNPVNYESKRFKFDVSRFKNVQFGIVLFLFDDIHKLLNIFRIKIYSKLKNNISRKEIIDLFIKEFNISKFNQINQVKLENFILLVCSGLENYFDNLPNEYRYYGDGTTEINSYLLLNSYPKTFQSYEEHYREFLKNLFDNIFEDKKLLKKYLFPSEYNIIFQKISLEENSPEKIYNILFRNLILNLASSKYYIDNNILYKMLYNILVKKKDYFLYDVAFYAVNEKKTFTIFNIKKILYSTYFSNKVKLLPNNIPIIDSKIKLLFYTEVNSWDKILFIRESIDILVRAKIKIASFKYVDTIKTDFTLSKQTDIEYDLYKKLALCFLKHFHYNRLLKNKDITLFNISKGSLKEFNNIINNIFKKKLEFYDKNISRNNLQSFGKTIHRYLFSDIFMNINYNYINYKKTPNIEIVKNLIDYKQLRYDNRQFIPIQGLLNIFNLSKFFPVWSKVFSYRIEAIKDYSARIQTNNKLVISDSIKNDDFLKEMFSLPAFYINRGINQFFRFATFHSFKPNNFIYSSISKKLINDLKKSAAALEKVHPLKQKYKDILNSEKVKNALVFLENERKLIKKKKKLLSEKEYNSALNKIKINIKLEKKDANILYAKYLSAKNKFISAKAKILSSMSELFYMVIFLYYHNYLANFMSNEGNKMTGPYYSLHKFDFRGRRYYTSEITSVTSSKINRLLVGFFGDLNDKDKYITVKLLFFYLYDKLFPGRSLIQYYSINKTFNSIDSSSITDNEFNIFNRVYSIIKLTDIYNDPYFENIETHERLLYKTIQYYFSRSKDISDLFSNNELITFLSYYTIELDHTTSGIQIVSLLLNSNKLQKMSTSKIDIYEGLVKKKKVYDIVKDYISENVLETENVFKDLCSKSKINILSTSKLYNLKLSTLIRENLTRDSIKLYIMGLQYGRTDDEPVLRKIFEKDFSNIEDFIDIEFKDQILFEKILQFIFFVSIKNTCPEIKIYQEIARSIAKNHFENSEDPLEWFCANKYSIQQRYCEIQKNIVERNKIKITTANLGGIDEIKNIVAFAPNFIHSIDSYLLFNVLYFFKKEYESKAINYFPIAIHDAYIVPLFDIVTLNNIIKAVYIENIRFFQRELIRLAKSNNIDTKDIYLLVEALNKKIEYISDNYDVIILTDI